MSSAPVLPGAEPVPGDRFEAEVRVEAVRFASPDKGFAVIEVSLADGSSIAAVGALAHLEAGSRVRLSGRLDEHSRFGIQVAAQTAVPIDPTGAEASVSYLRSLPNIGPSRAAALIERWGEDVFAAIDDDPVAAFSALRGLGSAAADQAAEAWEERRSQRRVYSLLAPHGLGRYVGELIAIHGSGASEAIETDPYALTQIDGIGFLSADRLALASGISPGSPERIAAAAVHLLSEAEQRGHTHLPQQQLVQKTIALLGLSEPFDAGPIATCPDLVIEAGRVYRAWTLEAEVEVAARMVALAAAEPAFEHELRDAEAGALTDAQRRALSNALTRRLSVITGGPGTGKTHLTDAMVSAARSRDLEVRLVAPTGRAARRLSQATGGAEATTIHKALEWIPGEHPGRDQHDPVEADLIIVDEASMLSLEISRHLLAAVGPDAHLVLIGDADQLPPVGPGKPFCELIDADIAATVRLDHIFRQASRSMIVGAAHAVCEGRVPESEPGPDEVQDFFTHSRSRPEDLAADVVRMVSERIPARYGLDPIRDVQVLAPQYRGRLGIDELNSRLREALCPVSDEILEGRFRIGEKVIATRSLPALEIANGMMFRIESADDSEAELMLETDVGDLLPLAYSEARILRSGFCASVHKAQGFEIPAVIVCLHSSHAPQLLSRNLAYTAITRARDLCVLAGDRRGLERALANTDALARHSRLQERLRGN